MIIDIHNHADYHGHNVDAVLRDMDENGIAVTCLLSWECPPTDYDPETKHAFSQKYFRELSASGHSWISSKMISVRPGTIFLPHSSPSS